MTRSLITVSLAAGLMLGVSRPAVAQFPTFPVKRCAADAVQAGTLCLDRFEASVWRVPNPTTANAILVRKIQLGLATRADLTAGGATQLGVTGDDYAPCTINGQSCANDIYAVSLASQTPSANLSWFQAQEACANSGKRLPTNAENERVAGPGAGQRDHRLQQRRRRRITHRHTRQLRLGARRLRHGGQPGRVGGGLGPGVDLLPGLGGLQQRRHVSRRIGHDQEQSRRPRARRCIRFPRRPAGGPVRDPRVRAVPRHRLHRLSLRALAVAFCHRRRGRARRPPPLFRRASRSYARMRILADTTSRRRG